MSEASVADRVSLRGAVSPASGRVSIVSGLGKLWVNRKLAGSILGAALVASLAYWALMPPQYEARAVLAFRTSPHSALRIEGTEPSYSGSFASSQIQLETLAGVLRSEQLAWLVILDRKLYQLPGFAGRSGAKYKNFRPDAAAPEVQAELLERFHRRLIVRTIPRTLLLEVRFRCVDPATSTAVVNSLLGAYTMQGTQSRLSATQTSSTALRGQLVDLKAQADVADTRLTQFQAEHNLLITPGQGTPDYAAHLNDVTAVDELGKQLASATSDRILREVQLRQAEQGTPESVLTSDDHLSADMGGLSAAAFRQIRGRTGDLQQEIAQLSAEHGPNFPRVVEIRRQLDDLDKQLAAQNALLLDRLRSGWRAAVDREKLLREALDGRTRDGLRDSAAAVRMEAMRGEANATRAVYLRFREKLDEAGLAAGMETPEFTVTDPPRIPAEPVAPDLFLDMAIALFTGFWLAVAAILIRDTLLVRRLPVVVALFFIGFSSAASAQAPLPSNSGLPTGVARIPPTSDNREVPNPAESPANWSGAGTVSKAPSSNQVSNLAAAPAQISPGDLLEITEFHTPEFRSVVRVSAAGSVTLPLIGDIELNQLDEHAAASAIAIQLVQRGMLLHPQVFVLVTAAAGQDLTVLGEVNRPGVYSYGLHHRLLDAISAASGVSATAGSLVYVSHRDNPVAITVVVLDPRNNSAKDDHNPELQPGDTVQVTRVGLVYVVGDVIRPGGFALDPSHPATVLQALSLAWGPTHNAALKRTILLHEQDGGRTLTSLNLGRMLKGQDPDVTIAERDILFVPDSAAKNLWNRTMESVVQSVIGVSIYAGAVYSQRF